MDVVAWVQERGRVVRADELRRHGASGRAITAAIGCGALQRPRRGWLATPDADPHLLAAARAGSC